MLALEIIVLVFAIIGVASSFSWFLNKFLDWCYPDDGEFVPTDLSRGFWKHYCFKENTELYVGLGEECNWCGGTKESEQDTVEQ